MPLLPQVLLPVYGSSCLVALVLHRCSAVVGRCVFRLYGLLPLLLRDYSKSLTLYRCVGGGCGSAAGVWGDCAVLVQSLSQGSESLGLWVVHRQHC